MTSMRDGREAGYGSWAADSAECLLVVGGYTQNAVALEEVVAKVKDQIDMSPSMADFFEVRFVNMGARPGRAGDVAAGVARLVLAFTRRPGDVARGFSALVMVEQSAVTIDRVLRDLRTDPVVSKLTVRYLGLANKDDRQPPEVPFESSVEIGISPTGRRLLDDLASDVYRYAESLLDDFGSGGEAGVSGNALKAIGSQEEPRLRGVIAAAAKADAEAAFQARVTEERKQAELRRKAEEQQRQARAQQEAEERRRAEARRQEAERHRQEIRERQQAAARRDAERRNATSSPQPLSGERLTEAQRRYAEEMRLRDEARRPAAARVAAGAERPGESPDAPRDMLDTTKGDASRLTSGARQVLRRAVGSGDASEPGPANVEEMLRDCARLAWAGDQKGVKARIAALRSYADSEITPQERLQYRVIMVDQQLLRPDLPLGTLDLSFYDMLFRLAYGDSLDYQRYCDLEDRTAAFGENGHLSRRRKALEAIDGSGTSDVRVLVLIRYHLGADRLEKWFRSRDVDLGRLVTALAAAEWHSPAHEDIEFLVTHRYLDSLGKRDDRREVAGALRANGYLAATLYYRYPNDVRSQVIELTSFLRAAYPQGLDAKAIADVFKAGVPTSALARAALRTLATAADGPLVARMFARENEFDELTPKQEAELLEHLRTDR
jgi:hypothetical protein